MHFRFRGNNVQVVRSQPDPDTGKAKSVPLGSINSITLEISDKLKANCTEAELEEIRNWVARYQIVNKLKRKHAAVTLPEQIGIAMQWFKDADSDSDEEARQLATEAISAMTELRKLFNRRGLL